MPLSGTDYIAGVTATNALEEIKTLLDRHLMGPVDYLPAAAEAAAASGSRTVGDDWHAPVLEGWEPPPH